MRIVDVSAFYSPHGGGVRTYVERKLRAVPALGHEMVVIAPGRRNGVVRRGKGAFLVTIASPTLPVDKRYRYFANRQALHDALDQWRPDFIEASSPWSSASKVGEWQGSAPRALVMHADPLSSYAYRWFGSVATRPRIDQMFGPFWGHLRSLDKAFDIVVSPGASLARRLTEGGLTKVRSVPLGVEPGIFSPGLKRPEVRDALLDRLNLPDDGLALIGLGRFAAEKRWPMVMRAVAAAAEVRPVGMLLMGAGKQEARILAAAGKSRHIDVSPAVRNRDELAGLMASADALVHGCESETFGLVAGEARASGLPIVVPDRGGAFDQLGAGAGLAYRAGSWTALRDAIVQLHDQPEVFAAARAGTLRTMDQHFRELIGEYEAIVEGGKAQAEPGRARSVERVAFGLPSAERAFLQLA